MKKQIIHNWIEFDELGKSLPGYEKTFMFGELTDKFVSEIHEKISKAKVDSRGLIAPKNIAGFLFPQEALKLYEMAWFNTGDILELGTHQGLSSFYMAHAMFDQNIKNRKIITCDVHKGFQDLAKATIERKGFNHLVEFHLMDAEFITDAFVEQKKKFGFVFVDHDHTYETNVLICRKLDKLVKKGGFVAFHDFNDKRNLSGVYGVYKAVEEGLSKDDFDFYGIFGSMAIFLRK